MYAQAETHYQVIKLCGFAYFPLAPKLKYTRARAFFGAADRYDYMVVAYSWIGSRKVC